MSTSALHVNVFQPPRTLTPLWMLDIEFYTVLGVHPSSRQHEINETYMHWEASKSTAANGLEDTTVADFQVRQAYAVLRNPLSRHKYDVKIKSQLTVLEAFETIMKEHIARLTKDVKAVEHYYLGRLKRQSVTEGTSRDKLKEIKSKISPSLHGPDMPVAVYASGLASHPPAMSGPAWNDYAHWWLSRDEARRERSNADQAWKVVQARRERMEKAVQECNAVTEGLASLRREYNSSWVRDPSDMGLRAEAEARQAGTVAVLEWLEVLTSKFETW